MNLRAIDTSKVMNGLIFGMFAGVVALMLYELSSKYDNSSRSLPRLPASRKRSKGPEQKYEAMRADDEHWTHQTEQTLRSVKLLLEQNLSKDLVKAYSGWWDSEVIVKLSPSNGLYYISPRLTALVLPFNGKSRAMFKDKMPILKLDVLVDHTNGCRLEKDDNRLYATSPRELYNIWNLIYEHLLKSYEIIDIANRLDKHHENELFDKGALKHMGTAYYWVVIGDYDDGLRYNIANLGGPQYGLLMSEEIVRDKAGYESDLAIPTTFDNLSFELSTDMRKDHDVIIDTIESTIPQFKTIDGLYDYYKYFKKTDLDTSWHNVDVSETSWRASDDDDKNNIVNDIINNLEELDKLTPWNNTFKDVAGDLFDVHVWDTYVEPYQTVWNDESSAYYYIAYLETYATKQWRKYSKLANDKHMHFNGHKWNDLDDQPQEYVFIHNDMLRNKYLIENENLSIVGDSLELTRDYIGMLIYWAKEGHTMDSIDVSETSWRAEDENIDALEREIHELLNELKAKVPNNDAFKEFKQFEFKVSPPQKNDDNGNYILYQGSPDPTQFFYVAYLETMTTLHGWKRDKTKFGAIDYNGRAWRDRDMKNIKFEFAHSTSLRSMHGISTDVLPIQSPSLAGIRDYLKEFVMVMSPDYGLDVAEITWRSDEDHHANASRLSREHNDGDRQNVSTVEWRANDTKQNPYVHVLTIKTSIPEYVLPKHQGENRKTHFIMSGVTKNRFIDIMHRWMGAQKSWVKMLTKSTRPKSPSPFVFDEIALDYPNRILVVDDLDNEIVTWLDHTGKVMNYQPHATKPQDIDVSEVSWRATDTVGNDKKSIQRIVNSLNQGDLIALVNEKGLKYAVRIIEIDNTNKLEQAVYGPHHLFDTTDDTDKTLDYAVEMVSTKYNKDIESIKLSVLDPDQKAGQFSYGRTRTDDITSIRVIERGKQDWQNIDVSTVSWRAENKLTSSYVHILTIKTNIPEYVLPKHKGDDRKTHFIMSGVTKEKFINIMHKWMGASKSWVRKRMKSTRPESSSPFVFDEIALDYPNRILVVDDLDSEIVTWLDHTGKVINYQPLQTKPQDIDVSTVSWRYDSPIELGAPASWRALDVGNDKQTVMQVVDDLEPGDVMSVVMPGNWSYVGRIIEFDVPGIAEEKRIYAIYEPFGKAGQSTYEEALTEINDIYNKSIIAIKESTLTPLKKSQEFQYGAIRLDNIESIRVIQREKPDWQDLDVSTVSWRSESPIESSENNTMIQKSTQGFASEPATDIRQLKFGDHISYNDGATDWHSVIIAVTEDYDGLTRIYGIHQTKKDKGEKIVVELFNDHKDDIKKLLPQLVNEINDNDKTVKNENKFYDLIGISYFGFQRPENLKNNLRVIDNLTNPDWHDIDVSETAWRAEEGDHDWAFIDTLRPGDLIRFDSSDISDKDVWYMTYVDDIIDKNSRMVYGFTDWGKDGEKNAIDMYNKNLDYVNKTIRYIESPDPTPGKKNDVMITMHDEVGGFGFILADDMVNIERLRNLRNEQNPDVSEVSWRSEDNEDPVAKNMREVDELNSVMVKLRNCLRPDIVNYCKENKIDSDMIYDLTFRFERKPGMNDQKINGYLTNSIHYQHDKVIEPKPTSWLTALFEYLIFKRIGNTAPRGTQAGVKLWNEWSTNKKLSLKDRSLWTENPSAPMGLIAGINPIRREYKIFTDKTDIQASKPKSIIDYMNYLYDEGCKLPPIDVSETTWRSPNDFND